MVKVDLWMGRFRYSVPVWVSTLQRQQQVPLVLKGQSSSLMPF